MKRKSERKHVKIYPESFAYRGSPRTRFIVCWTPEPNKRCKRSFVSAQDAEQEADRIESEMVLSAHALAKRPQHEIINFNVICAQFPDATLTEIAQVYAAYRTNNGTVGRTTLVREAGEEFRDTRLTSDFAVRHRQTVRQHMNRFVAYFGGVRLADLRPEQIKDYLDTEVGGVGKTRKGHLTTIRSLFHWSQERSYLPYGAPTAADQVQTPRVTRSEHEVYTPEELTRLLAASSTGMVTFITLGAFAGIRAEERLRLKWEDWRVEEDNKIVCNEHITKTHQRRRVDVLPNLSEWLSAMRNGDERMVPFRKPHQLTSVIAAAAGLRWKPNALRAGYASYHLELFDNAALTAKNDGHSVTELETTYKSIRGVTKASAMETFAITPHTVCYYAEKRGLPQPEWAEKIALIK